MRICYFLNSARELTDSKIFDNNLRVYSASKLHNIPNVDIELIDIEPKIKKQINQDVFEYVMNFGNEVFNNKSINEHLMFGNFNLWQYQRFRIYFLLRNIKYEVHLIQELIKLDYNKILIVSDYQYDLSIYNSSIIVERIKIQKKLNISIESIVKYALIFLFRAFSLSNFKRSTAKHLIYDQVSQQPVLQKDGSIKVGNSHLSYFYNSMGEDYRILSEYLIQGFDKPYSLKKGLLSSGHKNYLFAEHILFKYFFSLNNRKKFKRLTEFFQDKIIFLENNISDAKGKRIANLLTQVSSSSKFYIYRYLAFSDYFQDKSIISIGALDENGPAARSILDAAKQFGIATVGFQHGAIHRLHPNYRFSHSEIRYQPDYTLVWGKKWKDFLHYFGNYSFDSVKIVGQIRTDIISHLSRNENKKEFIVLFASQPQRDSVLRERTARDIFVAVKNMINTTLHIKLHPGEINDYGYYKNIAAKVGIANYKILIDAELYLTLVDSDIIITSFSTVGIEAVYFNKPLLVYDPLSQDIQGYIKDGVGFQVRSSDEIQTIINDLRTKNISINQLKYEKFISDNTYALDGLVVERVLNFFRSIELKKRDDF